MNNPTITRLVNQWGVVFLASLGLVSACGGAEANSKPTGQEGGSAGSGGGASGSGGGAGVGTSGSAGQSTVPFPCENPKPYPVAGQDVGYIECANGAIARREVKTCPSALPRAESSCSSDISESCSSDADCGTPYGRCISMFSGQMGGDTCFCVAGCVQDSDCHETQICECGEEIGTCVQADCSTSDDCEKGECAQDYYECSDDRTVGGTRFACQTMEDECFVDADCGDGDGSDECNVQGDARVCGSILCGIGRPFLVNNIARIATPACREDWRAGALPNVPNVTGLSDIDRADLASWWLDAALMEHASVAAFARFTLELMSLGAPPEIIEEATTAMSDETRHAKVCFALASTYRGEALGPNKLATDGALSNSSPRQIVAATIREGCLGETLAALEAALASERATDPVVKDALHTIHADETRHACLAWRFIRWALEEGYVTPAELEADFQSAVAASLAELSGSDCPASEGGREHGMLDGTSRRALRDAAVETVIRPALAQLTSPARSPDSRKAAEHLEVNAA